MQLKDVLVNMYGCNVKIGANNGTAFFFVGKVDHNTYELLNSRNDASYDTLCRLIRKYKESIEVLESYETLSKSDKALLKAKKEWFARYTGFKDRFVGVTEREVVEEFMSDASVEPEPTHVFIIEGFENGQYWTIKEAQTKEISYE